MRIDRIELSDFLGHEDTVIDFTAKPMAVITGPVGSGKSSIIDGITWALWGKSRARGRQSDPLVREGAQEARVRLWVFHDGQEFHIQRNRALGGTSSVTLTATGLETGDPVELTRHTNAETEQAIVELFDLTYEAALAGPLALQNGEGSLMDVQPRERKDLLLSLLVGGEWETWHERAKDRLALTRADIKWAEEVLQKLGPRFALEDAKTAYSDSLEHLNLQLADSRTRLREFEEDINRLTADIATIEAQEAEARHLKEQAEEHYMRFERVRSNDEDLLARLAHCEQTFDFVHENAPKVPKPAEGARQKALEAMLAAMQEATTTGNALAEARAHRMAAEANVSVEVTCPECGEHFWPREVGTQPEVLDRMKHAEAVAQAAFRFAEQNVRAAQHDERDARLAEESWTNWTRTESNAEAALRKAKEAVAHSSEEMRTLAEQGKKLDARLAELEPGLKRLDEKKEALITKLGLKREESERARGYEDRARMCQSNLLGVQNSLTKYDEASALVSERTQSVTVLERLTKAFHRNGIPTFMLESTLPNIERYANETLQRMPGDMSLSIRTQREKKSGDGVSETLDVLVSVGGRERPYEMLSGGQQFRVALSLRLALTRAISSQHVDTLIADEGFDRFQDPEGREAIMEGLLAVADGFSRIIVVSHHPDVIERFGNNIVVAMEEGVSHVA